MLRYTFYRVLSMIPVIAVSTLVIFMLIHLTAGDPARVMLGEEAGPQAIAALRERMGLNEPLHLQYLQWMGALARGDLGDSYFLHQPVTTAIANAVGPTFALAISAQVIAVLLAVPMGIAAARRRGELTDQNVQAVTLIGMAVPSFVLGLLLQIVVALRLGWLPVAGYVPLSEGLIEYAKYLALPAISLGVVQSAFLIRITRGAMLDVLGQDYMKTVKSKGLRVPRRVYVHALRNASLPILTAVGLGLGTLITGALVTETIFTLPGLGQLTINAVNRRDFPLLQGVLLFVTFLYLAVNLVIDLLYGLIDPRVRVR